MFRKYIFLSFSQFFFPFFLVLLFIASVVLLIDIAGRTYVVKMSFLDLFALFSYSLPGSIFFIIPITFFASLVLGVSKLAYDYELMVFFALGVKPIEILKTFLPIILLATAILLVFSLVMVPLAGSASKNFVAQKRADIDVNLRAGELGQKLGDWLVYVDEAKNRQYKNLILYSQEQKGQESFIVADEGWTKNAGGLFELFLRDGDAYFATNEDIKKIHYKEMAVRQAVGEPQLRGYDLYDYWADAFEGNPKKKRKFAQGLLVSLFPLASIFMILAFGVANPRFSSNKSYFYIIGATALYFVLVHLASDNFPFIGAVTIPIVWFIAGYILYVRNVKRYY